MAKLDSARHKDLEGHNAQKRTLSSVQRTQATIMRRQPSTSRAAVQTQKQTARIQGALADIDTSFAKRHGDTAVILHQITADVTQLLNQRNYYIQAQ